jgi:hypothetical protein
VTTRTRAVEETEEIGNSGARVAKSDLQSKLPERPRETTARCPLSSGTGPKKSSRLLWILATSGSFQAQMMAGVLMRPRAAAGNHSGNSHDRFLRGVAAIEEMTLP